MKCGSRRAFVTDMYINGEYLRSRTDNQYFCVVDETAEVGYVSGYTGDFRNLDEATRIRKYNPEKHVILRLEFVKNKQYFVEGYQAISIRNRRDRHGHVAGRVEANHARVQTDPAGNST
jgi:hypothetical protein